MSEFFLIRHGETHWNREGRFQGAIDSPLTQRGMAQARALGDRLQTLAVGADRIVVSPLGRTRQTAALIASQMTTSRDVIYDHDLAEVSLGSWDGLTNIDIEARWPGACDGAHPFNWYFRSPDGESYDAARDRARRWLNAQQGSAIVVSHGLFGRLLRGVYLGLGKEETLSLPVPQDQIWRLNAGRVEAFGQG